MNQLNQFNQLNNFSEQQPNLQPKIPKKKIVLPVWASVLIVVMAVVIVGLVSYETYRYFTPQPEPSELPMAGKEEFTPSPLPILGIKDKIFFSAHSFKDRNLYMTDKFGGNKTQLTDYPRPIHQEVIPLLQDVQAIDDEYLGYYRCNVEPGNFNCGIYKASINSKNPEELHVAGKEVLIAKITFANKDTFSYCANFYKAQENYYGKVYLFQEGRAKEIYKVNYGAGAIETSCSELLFSPNGKNILFGYGFKGETENIHIIDTDGNKLAEMASVKNVKWADNNTVYFSREIRTDRTSIILGIYSFDVLLKSEKKYCEMTEQVYDPKFSNDFQKIIYWKHDYGKEDDKGSIWLLNLSSCQDEKLLDNASHPLWISAEEILASNNFAIGDFRESYPTSMLVFNILTGEKHELFKKEDMESVWYTFISPLVNGGSHSYFFGEKF